MRRPIGAATLAAAALVLAGCAARSQDAAAPATSAPRIAAATTSDSSPGLTQASGASTATSASDTSAPAAVPGAPGRPACAVGRLRTTVLRGSGMAGRQFARITFTNTGTASCTITGYPDVSLRRAGAQLGRPAQRSGKPASTVALAPGQSASTMLTDYSTCNAPDADTVRIYPPDQPAYLDAPLDITGCRLVVDPVSSGG